MEDPLWQPVPQSGSRLGTSRCNSSVGTGCAPRRVTCAAWDRGVNTLEINALDTFRAGIAGCGHINELMGVLLEVNGVRSRGAAGFNPLYRVKNPGGGHTAFEVFDGTRWSFIDSFLGVYYPGTSAADFSTSAIGTTNVTVVAPPWQVDGPGQTLNASQPDMTLRDLFKYRVYADKSMRLPVAHLMRLRSAAARKEPYPNEQTYGDDMAAEDI
jgi:hypothetical protein